MKESFIQKSFQPLAQGIIRMANRVIEEYIDQGYNLTLRQLYYQFIAKDLFPDKWLIDLGGGQLTKNHERNYKKLGKIINDGRLAGLVDWAAIEDRTRKVRNWQSFDSVAEALQETLQYYCRDPWEYQENLVEIWVEKEALSGVFERTAMKYHVPLFCCRGYHSQSSAYKAAERFKRTGNQITILHFGDHDPSGLDMTRDIIDRFKLLGVDNLTIDRCSLNIDQVRELNPPPSPAKITDSRAKGYVEKFGHDSWELDAVSPAALNRIASNKIEAIIDQEWWEDSKAEERQDKRKLKKFISDCTEEQED